MDTVELSGRLALLDADDVVLVGEVDGRVAGFVAARHDDHVAEGPAVEVSAIVVDAGARRRGLATALMVAVEEWARARGRDVVRLRANIVREAAHRFYEQHGFAVVKRSTVFEKHLGQ